MDAELRPRPLLEEFLEGAGSARKSDERVGEALHRLLALVHALDHAKFAQARMSELALEQRTRHDAYDASARRQRGFGHRAHQSDLAAAIDQRQACARQRFTGRDRGIEISWIAADIRAAENANRLHDTPPPSVKSSQCAGPSSTSVRFARKRALDVSG